MAEEDRNPDDKGNGSNDWTLTSCGVSCVVAGIIGAIVGGIIGALNEGVEAAD